MNWDSGRGTAWRGYYLTAYGIAVTEHVTVDDGMDHLLAAIAAIVLIGANFVVLAGMIAQIHDGIQSDPAHSSLEMAGFVFIGNDANTSILRIGFRAVEGRKAVALLNQKRFESKIGFLRIVLLKDTNAELTGQRHSRPPPLLL